MILAIRVGFEGDTHRKGDRQKHSPTETISHTVEGKGPSRVPTVEYNTRSPPWVLARNEDSPSCGWWLLQEQRLPRF